VPSDSTFSSTVSSECSSEIVTAEMVVITDLRQQNELLKMLPRILYKLGVLLI